MLQGTVQIFSIVIIREHHICFCKSPVCAQFSLLVDRTEYWLSWPPVLILCHFSRQCLSMLVVLAIYLDRHLKGVGGQD